MSEAKLAIEEYDKEQQINTMNDYIEQGKTSQLH